MSLQATSGCMCRCNAVTDAKTLTFRNNVSNL